MVYLLTDLSVFSNAPSITFVIFDVYAILLFHWVAVSFHFVFWFFFFFFFFFFVLLLLLFICVFFIIESISGFF